MGDSLEANLYVTGDPGRARSTLEAVLQSKGWKITWQADGWTGMGTKGSKVMNVLFGAFAQYHELWFTLASLPDGNTHVRLYRTGSGIGGGLIGMSRVKTAFREVVGIVEAAYGQAGVLISSQKA